MMSANKRSILKWNVKAWLAISSSRRLSLCEKPLQRMYSVDGTQIVLTFDVRRAVNAHPSARKYPAPWPV